MIKFAIEEVVREYYIDLNYMVCNVGEKHDFKSIAIDNKVRLVFSPNLVSAYKIYVTKRKAGNDMVYTEPLGRASLDNLDEFTILLSVIDTYLKEANAKND